MDDNSVSSSSMHTEGLKLVADVWEESEYFQQDLIDLKFRDVKRIRELFTRVGHRLAFLELVTKGLAYETMHDARAYAKFVDSKRNLEDMDLEELRVMLR